ncbi:MAG TPA: hypothetical protein VGN60_00965 [Devosia sp.]|jgi:hypothetical protein|nr:hypothetical protein [Devosia sp.]
MRLLIIAMLGLATGSVQASEIYRCADTEGEIALAFEYDAGAVEPFAWVEMQLTGDFGISTDPTHRNFDGEFVSDHYVGEDFIGADLKVHVNSLPVMQFRIVRVSEGAHELMTGGVGVGGGGVWSVICQSELQTQ